MITKSGSCLMLSIFLFLCFFINLNLSEGADSITANQSLTANQTIVSAGGNFELGFFTPGTSSRSYVGIWYKKISQRTILWVANRKTPISDTNSAQLIISDGNLVLMNESQVSIWSTNVNSTTSKFVVATLRDDGNLVLRDGSTSESTEVFWQSFDYPTDTFLPGSKLGYDKRTKRKQILTSWRNSEDPATGLFSLELEPNGRQYIINRSTTTYWTSGDWNGRIFSLVPEMRLNYIFNFSFVDNVNESYFTYSLYNSRILSRLIMDVTGQIKQISWSESMQEWTLFWSQPRQQCQVYGYCGAFGICNQNSLPFCSCLPKFTEKSANDWNLRDYSGGCEREIDLQQCGNGSAATGGRDRDRFLAKTQVNLPENSQSANARSVGECESVCLNNCSCTAYTYNGNTCLVWHGELLNLQQLSDDDRSGRTINIRLAASTLSKEVKRFTKGALIATVACSIAFVIALLAIVGAAIRRRQRRTLETTEEIQGSSVVNLEWGDYSTGIGVPFVSWESILAATDNFSDVRKLGQGGFGPVYKGTFPGEKEVAVKRLSSLSAQGFDEFQNEVVLITKLQHRNLVCLVGYCIMENEKILLYEYLPNRSLDFFIFDKKLSILLSWRKRYEIILGIARGVLYLHQDSRLTIIHRDLKTSNILLDEGMNPKISDFGLARIFYEDEGAQVNTNRVVGTYGYMSPEYASYGIFSMKSDVFSFGVIILEMISGKKNTGFYQSTEAMNLLSYAWKLWSENKALDLLDPILVEFCDKSEAVKCINIGLLCVEEDPVNRPTMSNVVLMLSGETTVVPVPNQPAFAMRRHVFETSPSSSNKPSSISNKLTMSMPRGR